MNTMFDTLLQLPLFQGLSQDDFTGILEKVKLVFSKYKPGETILRADTPCSSLVFILKGEVKSVSTAATFPMSVVECLPAPYLIEPYSLFGMSVAYRSTYLAHTEVHTVTIDKSYLLTVLFDYEIFRLNYVNILSNRVQLLTQKLWNVSVLSLEKRIAWLFLSFMERSAGEKQVKIKMQELALLMNETRTSISKALNAMQEKELLELHRGGIFIPDAAVLTDFV